MPKHKEHIPGKIASEKIKEDSGVRVLPKQEQADTRFSGIQGVDSKGLWKEMQAQSEQAIEQWKQAARMLKELQKERREEITKSENAKRAEFASAKRRVQELERLLAKRPDGVVESEWMRFEEATRIEIQMNEDELLRYEHERIEALNIKQEDLLSREQALKASVDTLEQADSVQGHLLRESIQKKNEKEIAERQRQKEYKEWNRLLESVRGNILPRIRAKAKFLGVFPGIGPIPREWFSLQYAGQGDLNERKRFDQKTKSVFPGVYNNFKRDMEALIRLYERFPGNSREYYDRLCQVYETFFQDRDL